MILWFFGGRSWVQKSIKNRSTWKGIWAPMFDRFWWILGGKLGAMLEKKWNPKDIIFKVIFGIDFLSNLGPSWEPSWSHVGDQNRSKVAPKIRARAKKRP